jgi:hypothetical protein
VPLADRRVYAIAAYTGVRPEELFYLRWRDVRLDGQKPRIHVHGAYDVRTGREKSTKTGEERDVPIHPHLRALLTFMRDAADDPDARVVLLVSRKRHGERYADMVRPRLRKARVTRPELLHGTAKRMPFDLRSFRTTFATWAVSAGYERALVGTWLGHKPNDTTSLHYVKDVPGFEDVLIRAWRAGAVPPFPELPADVNGHVKCERKTLFSRAKRRRGRDSKLTKLPNWRRLPPISRQLSRRDSTYPREPTSPMAQPMAQSTTLQIRSIAPFCLRHSPAVSTSSPSSPANSKRGGCRVRPTSCV